jgi:hypothetical protein
VYGTVSKTLKIKLHKTMFKLIVMCGCGTWSKTEKDEVTLNIYERNVLRKMN